MSVRRFLDCSTGNLRLSTRDWLDGGNAPMACYRHGFNDEQYGWLIYVPDDDLDDLADGDDAVPQDLLDAFIVAGAHGCDYILFDRDAPACSELDWFEDGEVALVEPTVPKPTTELGERTADMQRLHWHRIALSGRSFPCWPRPGAMMWYVAALRHHRRLGFAQDRSCI